MEGTQQRINSYIDQIDRAEQERQLRIRILSKHDMELYRKFTLSLACLLMFFIGAPLGAIIRKGGMGMPVVVAVIIFLFYYIISNMTEEMGKGEDPKLSAFWAMWTSSAILVPFALGLTLQANMDSGMFRKETYVKLGKWLFRRK